jgi:hypothetical protein
MVWREIGQRPKVSGVASSCDHEFPHDLLVRLGIVVLQLLWARRGGTD